MRRASLLFLVSGVVLFLCPLPPDGATRAEERMRIAPASGGAEVAEIKIIRWSALHAVKTADLTNMHLKLWFPASWKKNRDHHLVRIRSLDPIEDDTGKLLSTGARRNGIEYLRGEVRGDEWMAAGGKGGPFASLFLDAPSRRADKIKSIKGKAEVSLAKAIRLTFDDLASIQGKELEHPDFKGLRAMKLKFSIKEDDGRVTAKMAAPLNFASPWNLGRLRAWAVVEGKKDVRLSSEGVSPQKEGVTEQKKFTRRGLKGLSLRLVVLDPVESVTFDFDFQNVPLP